MNEELLEAQKVRDKLYEKDLVYRALVDNLILLMKIWIIWVKKK